MPESPEYISHDITLRAAIARTDEHPGSVAQRIDDFTAQMTRHLGVTDWEAPLAGKWEGDLQTKMNTAMRMARDVLDMDAGERGLNMTLTATHGDHDITAIFTHAPVIGTTVPLNYVTVRIANGDPSKQVTLDDAFLMIQILVATFEPQVASVTSTELALHSTPTLGWQPPIGYLVWLPQDTDTLTLPGDSYLQATPLSIGGTLLSVIPVLTERSIGTILTDFYTANNITDIPHG